MFYTKPYIAYLLHKILELHLYMLTYFMCNGLFVKLIDVFSIFIILEFHKLSLTSIQLDMHKVWLQCTLPHTMIRPLLVPFLSFKQLCL